MVWKRERVVPLGIFRAHEDGEIKKALVEADGDIEKAVVGYANRAREGSITLEELTGGTFTITNGGVFGSMMSTPIINPPQSAILGVNAIVPRPKELGDGVYAFVPFIGLSLTYDHRSLDGGEATRFLKQIATEIETLEMEW